MDDSFAMLEATMHAMSAFAEQHDDTRDGAVDIPSDADLINTMDDAAFGRGIADVARDMERKLQALQQAYSASMRHQHLLEHEHLQMHWQQQHAAIQHELQAQRAQTLHLSHACDRATTLIDRLATAWSRSHSTALLSRTLLGWRRVARHKAHMHASMPRAQQHYARHRLMASPFAAWRHATAVARPGKVKQRTQAAIAAACATAARTHQAEVASLQQQLSAARLQVEEMQQQQAQLQADVEQALSRGVRALNTEAMAAIHRRPTHEAPPPTKGAVRHASSGRIGHPASPKTARPLTPPHGAIPPPPCFVEHSPPATHITPSSMRHARYSTVSN